jgi:Tfp pilus assembly protein FimT
MTVVSREHRDDAGVTLVELLVYIFITVIIGALMAGVFINGLKSQTTTTDRDTATGKAQVVTNSLQTSLRNASAVSPASGTTNALVALVATGSSGWQCRAWVLTSAGTLVYRASSSAINTGNTTGWTVLASGVTGTFTGGKAFSLSSSTQVGYAFSVSVSSATVPISGAVTAQAVMTGGGPCW